MIFTAGDVGDEEVLLALSLDGKLLWKAANGEAWQGACPGSRTTPHLRRRRPVSDESAGPTGRLRGTGRASRCGRST